MQTNNNVQLASGLRPLTAFRLTLRVALLLGLSIAGSAIHSCLVQTCVLQATVSVSSGTGPRERLPGVNLILPAEAKDKTAPSAATDE